MVFIPDFRVQFLQQPGCIEIKSLFFQNLRLEAHKEEDIKLFEEFLNYAANATAEIAYELIKTKAYQQRNMGEIIPEVELLVHNLVIFMKLY